MSAMPALDWPEDDPASETDATWTFPDWLMPAETARRSSLDQPASPQAPSAQAAGDHVVRHLAVRGPSAHEHTVGGQAVGGQAVRSVATRGPAIRAQVVPAQVAPGQKAHVQVVQARASRRDAAPAPLRLTRRGRIVVAAAAALLVTLLSLLLTGGAWAVGPAAPSHGANRSLAQIIVLPGQSLWSVAQTADPNADPRQVMQQIVELNGLSGDTIQAGQRLWVPRG